MQQVFPNSIIQAVKLKSNQMQTTGRSPRFMLLMPDSVREEIEKHAKANGRTITAEINRRLRDSLTPNAALPTRLAQAIELGLRLPASYTTPNASTTYPANEQSPGDTLTDIDRAMLAVFRALPPEKQLALLSLFK